MDLAAATQSIRRESPLLLHSPIPIHRPVPLASPTKKGSKTMSLGTEEEEDGSLLLSQIMDEDEDTRPTPSYKELIIEAIESVPEKRLKLSEIYQVIKYHYPFYHRRADQWGWQNSIRHNLSLHDCFIKLPLKQTSASGVVGHYWTINRDVEEKQTSTRKRNRASGTKHTKSCPSSKNPNYISQNLKGKDRQSVSSLDSGMMSEESQANSPTSALPESSIQQPKNFIFPMLTPASSIPLGSSPNSNLLSPIFPIPDSLVMGSKHLLLADLLSTNSTGATTSTAAPPPVATSSYSPVSNSLPMMSQLNGLLAASQTGATAGIEAISDLLSLSMHGGNVAGELQRLQLINLYMYQQGLLQQIVLDNSNANNNGIFGLNAQPPVEIAAPQPQLSNSSGGQGQIPLLAQLFLSKLSNPPPSCHKFTPPHSPSCPDIFSSPNNFKNVQVTTPNPEIMVSNTASVVSEPIESSSMDIYRQLLEQYMLNNSIELNSSHQSKEGDATNVIKESDPILI